MIPTADSVVADVFIACADAMRNGVLVRRVSRSDKEFHFQNWVRDRIEAAALQFDAGGRNSYPDFTLVSHAVGFEVKGLQWPGREANYDSNSRVPTGLHNGRTVYYVFGRYPAATDDAEYPVVDLVLCHGDFLNADHTYVHANKSFRGFGSYGDLLVRDRKMYVAPTPFAITDGTTGQATLIAPAELDADGRLERVGNLVRVEAPEIVVGYSFDLLTNSLTPEVAPNPSAGVHHEFVAYRLAGSPAHPVSMKESSRPVPDVVTEVED